MDPATIAMIIEALAKAAVVGYNLYNDSSSVLSESDAKLIHDALVKAEAATALLRPKANLALDEASQKV